MNSSTVCGVLLDDIKVHRRYEMKRKQAVLILAMALLLTTAARAQEKESAEKTPAPPEVPLIVQVVFSEYDGDKKISSLPYTVPVNAVHRGRSDSGQVRMGIRVPLTTSSGQDTKIQYMDIGTNIDCWAVVSASGQFNLHLTVERNSIYSTGAEGKPVEWTANERLAIASQPIVRHYRASMELQMKDGQTVQRSVATDPLSGRVLKVDVTLNVVK